MNFKMSLRSGIGLVVSCVAIFPGSISGATMAVDWLEFRREINSNMLIGSDDAGRDLVVVRLTEFTGTLVPGSPSSGSLAADGWSTGLPFVDSESGDFRVPSFRTQATGFGGEVSYVIEVQFAQPKALVVFGVGQLYSSTMGETGALKIGAASAGGNDLPVSAPATQIAWDNGISRHSLPLIWSSNGQTLEVAGQDPQAQNSEFAFFEMGLEEEVESLRFEVPQAYARGTGDVLEFAVGVAIPEPSSSLFLMMLIPAGLLLRCRRLR